MRKCKKCGRFYKGHPAISRVDNSEICPECGTREALEGMGIEPVERESIIKTVKKYVKNAFVICLVFVIFCVNTVEAMPTAGYVDKMLPPKYQNVTQWVFETMPLNDSELKTESAADAPAMDVSVEPDPLIKLFGYAPSSDAIMLMKRVCMAEGGNTEPIEGLVRIFEVVANRCRSDRFPNTVCEVLQQKNQFETVATGRIWRHEVNERVEQAWKIFIDRGYCVDSEVLYFTAGGYNECCTPRYKLGNHYFGG